MLFKTLFNGLLALTLCFSHPSFAAVATAVQVETEGESGTIDRFHLVFPTVHHHWLSSRAESARVEIREMPLKRMSEGLKRARPLIPEFRRWGRTPTGVAYISPDRTPAQIEAIVAEAKAQLKEGLAEEGVEVEPRIIVKMLAPEIAKVEVLAHQADVELDHIAETQPEDGALQQSVEKVKELNREALQEALAMPACPTADSEAKMEAVLDRVMNNAMEPAEMRKTVCKFAFARGFLVMVSRAGQVLHLAPSATGALAAGFALIAGDTAAEYYSIKFQTNINKLFKEHGLPWKVRGTFLNYLSDAYRHSAGAQFVKALLLNILVNGLAKPLATQQVAHLTAPELSPAVAWSDAGDLGINSGIGTFFYVAGAQGADWLRQKGWLTQTQIELAFRYVGILDVASNFMNSNPMLRPYRSFTQWPVWGTYFAAFAISLAMPIRKHRFVLIDSGIRNRPDVNALEVTDLTWETGMGPGQIEAAVREVGKLRKVSEKSWCWQLLQSCFPSH